MPEKARGRDQARPRGTVVSLSLFWAAGALLALPGALGLLSGNAMRYLMQIFLYITLGEAWNLLSGFAGLTSLGQQLYIGLAGYALAMATTAFHLPWGVGLLLGAVICAAVSLLLSLILFRMNGMYFAIASWVAAEAVSVFFLSWKFVNQGGGVSVSISPYPPVSVIYFFALGLCLAALTAVCLLLRSRVGFGLMALRDDPAAAAALGVRTGRVKRVAFVVSAVLTGLAGGLFFLNKGVIYPDSGFSISWTVSTVFIVIIGGSGTVGGPVAGAVIYVLLNEFLAHYPGWSNIMLGLLTILVILFLPDGLIGTLERRTGTELFSRRRYPETRLAEKRGRKKA